MATWVKLNEVEKFPNVIKKYQHTTFPSFRDSAEIESRTNKVWARVDPSEQAGNTSTIQVDVTAIPKVLPLTDNGRIK